MPLLFTLAVGKSERISSTALKLIAPAAVALLITLAVTRSNHTALTIWAVVMAVGAVRMMVRRLLRPRHPMVSMVFTVVALLIGLWVTRSNHTALTVWAVMVSAGAVLMTVRLLFIAALQRVGNRATPPPAEVDRLIAEQELALADGLVPGKNHARALTAVASLYLVRHLRTHAAADAERGVEFADRAVEHCPRGHWHRLLAQEVRLSAHLSLARRTGTPQALDRAVAVSEEVLAEHPPAHHESGPLLGLTISAYAMRMQGLSGELRTNSPSQRYRADLDRVAELCREQSRAGPSPSPRHLEKLIQAADLELSRALEGLYLGETRDGADMPPIARGQLVQPYGGRQERKLARAASRAERDLPDGHLLLASGLALACNLAQDSGQVVPAAELQRLARRMDTVDEQAPPRFRISAAHELGLLAAQAGDGELAVKCLDAALRLQRLVLAEQNDLDRVDQEYRLGEHPGLASDALAMHLAAGDLPGAVEVAESGRALLLTQDADRRAGHAGPHPNTASKHPGRTGPVVVISAAQARCDAIILVPGDAPVLVSLPDLAKSDVDQYTGRLLAMATSPRQVAMAAWRRNLASMLGWLWETAVGPVLTRLDGADRVCWLPIGPLGQLPLHAACLPGQSGALEQVVSSYTPTLRLRDQPRPPDPVNHSRRQLTVAPGQSPGLPELTAAVAEADAVNATAPDGTKLHGADATVQRVLAALPQATWAHFACHATADPVSPSAGGLHLQDGLLSLATISALDLPHAELAYLSACSTASPGPRLADQALHLASAFQLAGFRQVVASLWPVDDHAAATMAQAFYQAAPNGPADGATALSRACRELRTTWPDRPDLWAPFIHVGS